MYLGASSLQGNAESNSDSAFSTRAHLSIGEQHLFSGPANRTKYGYDAADRLVRVDYGAAKRVDYGLDVLGNRVLEDTTTSPPSGLVRNAGTFNAFNQLTASGGPGTAFPVTTSAWDLNGNLISEAKSPSGAPAEVTTYGWDRDNWLRSVTLPTGVATSYVYSASGMRTQRVDATGTTRYLLDGASVLAELDGANLHKLTYASNPQVVDELFAYARAAGVEYPLVDALGSIYAAADAGGAVGHRYEFDVFGVRTDLGGALGEIARGYTAREHDPNGLLNYRSRVLAPAAGRFLSLDLGSTGDGPNRYSYVRARPTMFVDPMGTTSFLPGGGVAPDALSYVLSWSASQVASFGKAAADLAATVVKPYNGDTLDRNIERTLSHFSWSKLLWWPNQVNRNGEWDYRLAKGGNHPELNAFTQLNVGATGSAAGYPPSLILFSGDLFQAFDDFFLYSPRDLTAPGQLRADWTGLHYDDPIDTQWIEIGITYFYFSWVPREYHGCR